MSYDQPNKYSTSRIVILYLVFAALYISISDILLFELIAGDYLQTKYQIFKGLLFVFITSIALYYLVNKHDHEQRKLIQQNNVYDELITKLFDRIPAMITVYHPELKRFRVNREFEEKTGWSNQDVNRIDLMKASYPNPEIRKEVNEFMSNPGSGWKEFETSTKDRNKIPTSWTNIRLSDDTQIGIGIDLTDVKKKEGEIAQSQKLLQRTFESLKESVILLNPETRTITECNKATEDIFGYSGDELIDKTTRILHVDEEHFQAFHERSIEELKNEGSVQTEFKMKRKNGDVFDSDHTVTFVYDEKKNAQRVVSVIRDITDRKEHERKLRESLREKETLLQEVHHRVKNNLALVVGFLWFQKIKSEDLELQDIFEKNILRVRSIALIHEIIYQSESLADIELKKYFKKLIEAIEDTFRTAKDVTIQFTCDDTVLNANQALPSALVVNELISNALKHAFPDERSGKVTLTIREQNGSMYFQVEDTGIGLPVSFDEKNYGLGFDIINTLMDQLEGELDVATSDNGTKITFSFKKKDVKGSASQLI